MLIEFLFKPLIHFVNLIISFLPNSFALPSFIESTISLISKGLFFFPSDLWVIVISNITFWLTVQIAWAVIEWVYIKIPGVS